MGAWCPPSVAASSASPVPPALHLYPAIDRDGVHRELDPEHLALDLPGEIGWHSSSVFLVREGHREHLWSVFPGEFLEYAHHIVLVRGLLHRFGLPRDILLGIQVSFDIHLVQCPHRSR